MNRENQAADLATAFKAHTEGRTNFTRRMAIDMADFFDMRPMSLVWRLEKMGLVKRGSWEWFQSNGGITQHHIAEARADRSPAVISQDAKTTERR